MQSPSANISLMSWNLWKIIHLIKIYIYGCSSTTVTEVYKKAFGGPSISSGRLWTEWNTHPGHGEHSVLAACFTPSCWMKPSPVPPVHQRCPEHQSQAYGEGKVLCNRRGKTKVAFPRFLCPLLLLLPPSQLVRCLCQPGGHGGLLATGTLLPAAGKAEQDRGAQGWRRASLERRMGEGRMRKSGRAELHF